MQLIDFSLGEGKLASLKLCFAPTYGSGFKMNSWLVTVFLSLLSSSLVLGVVPGRRHQLAENPQNDPQGSYWIEHIENELSRYREEQARLRFQQQIHQQHLQKQNAAPQEITGPGFSFILPPITKAEFNKDNGQPFQFAVKPFDSRFYENSDGEEPAEDVDESSNASNNEFEQTLENKNKILIPPPMHVMHESGSTDKILHRAQQKAKLQQQQQQQQAAADVMQKPLQVEFDSTMSLYIVALIAGLSCAFSTGLIALGLMYWTLYKKSKSADACDFNCDYGVIGPRSKNQENSQLAMGDKKLAHSAQMFHYQHQKQQIISMMENRNAEMGHNEDDNDSDDNENDFTVYECPGLAEWDSGMEVKNPLFSEETPATKADKAQPPSAKAANQK